MRALVLLAATAAGSDGAGQSELAARFGITQVDAQSYDVTERTLESIDRARANHDALFYPGEAPGSLRIARVKVDSVFSAMGLRDHDMILSINGIALRGSVPGADITRICADLRVKKRAVVRLRRRDRVYDVVYRYQQG
jgi:hypothetical protein